MECRIGSRQVSIVCEPIEEKRKVTTSYGARFSLPYKVAVALVMGRVGLEQFSERHIKDKRILSLTGIVDYIKDEKLSKARDHFPGDVTIEMKNRIRYRHSQKYERGSEEHPLR